MIRIVLLETDNLSMRIPGDIIKITKSDEEVQGYQSLLTKFAYDSLRKLIKGEYITIA